MSDTLSWGSKLKDFCKWVEGATSDDLKQWLKSVKGREWTYRDEIPIVKSALKTKFTPPSPQNINEVEVQKCMKKALRIRNKLNEYQQKYYDALKELTDTCIHPDDKIISWSETDIWGDVYCGYSQCTQCGLRERGSYSVIFKMPVSRLSRRPPEADRTFTRTISDDEINKFRKIR